jgi:hypothetical protein
MHITTTKFNTTSDIIEHYNESLNLEDGESFESLENSDDSIIDDSIEVLETDNHIIVGFLKRDDSPMDYLENDDGAGEFLLFTNAEQRDQLIKDLKKSKQLFYLVDKYEHGNVHFSISSTTTYPDQRWDVSFGCGVFLPCDDIQSQYKKLKRKSGETVAFQEFIADSNNVLDNYSEWCNGEVYGYNIFVFDKKGNELSEDSCWGYIGNKNAEDEKLSTMQHIAENLELTELAKNVIIENKSFEDIKTLPFTIDIENLQSFQYTKVYNTTLVAATYNEPNKAIIYSFKDGDKIPTVAKFEEWQTNHGVTPSDFLTARLDSDIKGVIKQNLEHVKTQSTNKP